MRALALLTTALLATSPALAQHAQTVVAQTVAAQTVAAPTAAELRAVRAVHQAQASPPQLRALLVRMPKGGDLHMHLSGAVYAETFVEDARADLLCLNLFTHTLVPNVGTSRFLPPQPVCPQTTIRAADAFTDQKLYDALIDAFSMRTFVPSSGTSGHDQFFSTFDRFDPTHTAGARHGGQWVDQVASRAAAQNEQHLEIMHTPDLGRAIRLAEHISWPTSPVTTGDFHQDTTGTSVADLSAARKALLATPDFESSLAADQAEFSTALSGARAIGHCGQPQAAPACSVDVRFLFQVLRANSPAIVFAQTLLAFEIAQRELDLSGQPGAAHAQPGSLEPGPSVVGLNFVQPEDNRVAMAEYTRQMRLIGFLHGLYPNVHISLHAGELAEGLVPPEGLRFHIRQAVEIAHAERIGHGVDIMHEDDAGALLQDLAARHVMTEINLTSNDVILNVAGVRHPLPTYRAANIPIALSTDDEGVSRIDLTHEYVRAVLDFHLGYLDLKRMARTSLEHSFLPGASLWRAPDNFTRPVAACAAQPLGSEHASPACADFLHFSPHAAEQWELERRFTRFEAALP